MGQLILEAYKTATMFFVGTGIKWEKLDFVNEGTIWLKGKRHGRLEPYKLTRSEM